MTNLLRLLLLAIFVHLSGCAAVVTTTAIVATDMATDRRTSGMYIEDQAIEVKSAKELGANEEIDQQADVNVTSFNRIVLITGQAPTPAMKRQATEIVRNIDNVRRVHNEVRVKAPESFLSGTNDAWLTTKTKSMLLAEKGLDSNHIKVITENGEVFLMGLVTREESQKAIAVVREIDGVEAVVEVFEYLD